MPVAANDPRVQRAAFAHLVGNDIDYLMKKYEITLGRQAKNFTPDVIMGDTMSVSRQHAKILYNFDTQQFELIVLGRNGVMIDGALYEPEYGPIPLKSKALLQIGEASFYFLLPKKLSKLFKSQETAGKSTAVNVGKPSSTSVLPVGAGVLAEGSKRQGAGAATTTKPPAALPTQQQMIQLIQEAAARQQQQQQVVLAAAVAAQQQQQQQQQALSPVQLLQLQQLQQQRQQLAGAEAGGANLSPQQMQQIQIQMLLQQQRLMQQQQQQQKSPPK